MGKFKIDFSKAIKIIIGFTLALWITDLMGLEYATSAGLIALLSILNTKKETIFTLFKRLFAFVIAVIIGYISFYFLGFTVVSFGVYLLFFVPFAFLLKLDSAVSISSVLISHFWIEQNLSGEFLLNEILILVIGAGIGTGLNLIMPRQIKSIKQQQKNIDSLMKQVLNHIAASLSGEENPYLVDSKMEELTAALATAKVKVREGVENTLTSDFSYYLHYTDMRRNQNTVLKKIILNIKKPTFLPPQAEKLSEFVREISSSFHENNNAQSLLESLENLTHHFRQGQLPKTREEFETRAVLFLILSDLDHFLQLKKEFVSSITENQKKIFWQKEKVR